MKIVYRIAGFEGEATENRVDRLNDEDQESQDPEKKYEIANILLENCDCLAILLRRMKDFRNNESLLTIGKLLSTISQVNAVREKIIELNGVGILLNTLLNRLGQVPSAENDQITEFLIATLGNIVVSTEKQGNSSRMQLENEGEEEECMSFLRLCFEKLEELKNLVPKPEKTISILTRILPFLAKDYLQTNVLLIEKHMKNVDFNSAEPSSELERLLEIIEVVPKKFTVFRDLCNKYGVLKMIAAYFSLIIPNELEIRQENLQNQQKSLSIALKIIKGVIFNNKANQLFLHTANLLAKIYNLSNTSIKVKEIGKTAETIIEYLLQSDPSEIHETVLQYLKKVSQEEKLQKKRLAELKRQEILQSMRTGNRFLNEDKGKQMEIEEEKSICCIICHEGYNINPKNLLGVYLFSKPHKIPDENVFLNELLCKEVNGIASVTHFNCIHLKCHSAAAKAELSLKKPKKEWEGAIIRNSHTKCNNWFPLKGEGILLNDYEAGINKYFVSIDAIVKNDLQSRSWIVLNDLKNLMMKFGKQESLSKESKGGSYEHNAKIIPFYLQMFIYLVNREDTKKFTQFYECFQNILAGKTKELAGDLLYLCLTCSLFVINSEEFFQNKLRFFELFVRLAVEKRDEKLAKSLKKIEDFTCFENGECHEIFKENGDLIMKIRPFLILFSLIKEIFKKVHAKIDKTQKEAMWKLLEEELTKNYQNLIKSFEEISNIYRNEITKLKSLEEFCIFTNIVERENSYQTLKSILDRCMEDKKY